MLTLDTSRILAAQDEWDPHHAELTYDLRHFMVAAGERTVQIIGFEETPA